MRRKSIVNMLMDSSSSIIIFTQYFSSMMQVIDNHLLLSPPMKGQSSPGLNQCGSETRSNASVDSNRSHGDAGSGNKGSKSQNAKAKSSLCRNFMEKGCCPYGNKCQFAHGLNQLRCNSERQMLYKTRQCNAFIKNCVCMYGSRCNFLHAADPQDTSSDEKTCLTGYRDLTSKWAHTKTSTLLMLLNGNQHSTIY